MGKIQEIEAGWGLRNKKAELSLRFLGGVAWHEMTIIVTT